jgi:hypothetical protein
VRTRRYAVERYWAVTPEGCAHVSVLAQVYFVGNDELGQIVDVDHPTIAVAHSGEAARRDPPADLSWPSSEQDRDHANTNVIVG